MRVVVTAESGEGIQGQVAGHFGHAPYFAVVEVSNGLIENVEVHQNPYAVEHKPGQVPTFVRSLAADVILTGGMGESAAKIFEKVGISAFTGAAGSVEDAVQAYLAGNLPAASACAHEGHGHGHDHGHDHDHGHGHPVSL